MAAKKENSKTVSGSEIDTLREKLREIRFGAQGAKSKNVKETSKIKKQIAKILTKMNQEKKQ